MVTLWKGGQNSESESGIRTVKNPLGHADSTVWFLYF